MYPPSDLNFSLLQIKANRASHSAFFSEFLPSGGDIASTGPEWLFKKWSFWHGFCQERGRYGFSGEIIILIVVLKSFILLKNTIFSIMAYLHNLDPFFIQFTGNFGIRWYGLSYLAGFILSYCIARIAAKQGRSSLSKVQAGDFVFAITIGTIVGGRLGYCLLYSPDLLWRFSGELPFWGVLAIHDGGMASHGGILGIVLACWYFARSRKISLVHLIDIVALSGTLGIFFGRIANFINGELVGRICSKTFPLAVKFPQDMFLWQQESPERLATISGVVREVGVSTDQWVKLLQQSAVSSSAFQQVQVILHRIIEKIQAGDQVIAGLLRPFLDSRHPSQLYAAFLEGLLLFIILFWIWKKVPRDGIAGVCFLLLYPVARFFSEFFRMPDAHIGFQFLGLTRGQLLSVGMFILGCVALVVWKKQIEKKVANAHY